MLIAVFTIDMILLTIYFTVILFMEAIHIKIKGTWVIVWGGGLIKGKKKNQRSGVVISENVEDDYRKERLSVV